MAEKLKIAGTTYLKFKKGKVTTKGEEGEKHVKVRIIDFGDSKGQTVHEVQMDSITGVISRVQVVKGSFGEELLLTMENAIGNVFISKDNYDERQMEVAVITVPVSAMGYFETLAAVLPAIKLEEEVTIKPYDFVPAGKEYSTTGATVMQGGKRVNDYFRKKDGVDANGKPKYKAVNGAPESDIGGEHDDWKEFFEERRKFLKKFIKKNIAEEEVVAPEEKGGMVEEDMPF